MECKREERRVGSEKVGGTLSVNVVVVLRTEYVQYVHTLEPLPLSRYLIVGAQAMTSQTFNCVEEK
jgi:hypothetical protein